MPYTLLRRAAFERAWNRLSGMTITMTGKSRDVLDMASGASSSRAAPQLLSKIMLIVPRVCICVGSRKLLGFLQSRLRPNGRRTCGQVYFGREMQGLCE